jgi:hypothetical protein
MRQHQVRRRNAAARWKVPVENGHEIIRGGRPAAPANGGLPFGSLNDLHDLASARIDEHGLVVDDHVAILDVGNFAESTVSGSAVPTLSSTPGSLTDASG